MMRKGAKSTMCLIDQFIPELWERKPHQYLSGFLSTFRYRQVRNLESKIAMFKIRRSEPPVLPVPYEVLVESHFRTLNACLVTGEDRVLRDVATDEFCRTLQAANASSERKTLNAWPHARVIRFSEPPRLVQSRIFAMSDDEDDAIAQLTFKVRTEQKLLGNPVNTDIFPIPFEQRKTWFPYSVGGITGATHYFYPLTGEKQAKLTPTMRFTPLPLPVRGTFGATGEVLKREGAMIEVENHVVMERLVKFSRGVDWKIHHF